jgi:hypothetical protein
LDSRICRTAACPLKRGRAADRRLLAVHFFIMLSAELDPR